MKNRNCLAIVYFNDRFVNRQPNVLCSVYVLYSTVSNDITIAPFSTQPHSIYPSIYISLSSFGLFIYSNACWNERPLALNVNLRATKQVLVVKSRTNTNARRNLKQKPKQSVKLSNKLRTECSVNTLKSIDKNRWERR